MNFKTIANRKTLSTEAFARFDTSKQGYISWEQFYAKISDSNTRLTNAVVEGIMQKYFESWYSKMEFSDFCKIMISKPDTQEVIDEHVICDCEECEARIADAIQKVPTFAEENNFDK